MNSGQHTQRPGTELPQAHHSARRGLAAAAAGLALAAALTAGPATAAPAPLHTDAPGCMPAAPAQTNILQWASEPPMTIDTSKPYNANLGTNCGTITVALSADKAPHTVNSFVFLADQHYFDNTKCHRLTTQGIFVLQCGDPKGNGTGGPGYHIDDENLSGATYPAGTVAMANAGPNTNGSQFFLVYANSQLPPNYTPFGRITTGMDVLTNIAGAGTKDGSGDGAPASDIVLTAVTTAQG
ncbi:peptidylprolyl isomerase [Nocardia sp. NPDC088792]|uniref:peptidylprolyl isomerase n=1 Tax=Nocardia sp. NPDC088792 TaxID=3364332 RepID=UPI00382000A5